MYLCVSGFSMVYNKGEKLYDNKEGIYEMGRRYMTVENVYDNGEEYLTRRRGYKTSGRGIYDKVESYRTKTRVI